MPRSLGPQPAKQALWDERWTIRRAASEIGVEYSHLGNIISGKVAPSPIVRERLPLLLNVPLAALFTEEALAAQFRQAVDR